MTIRKMTISDYEAVYSLWISCKGMGLNDVDDSKDGIERYLNRNPDTCFVAEIGNEVVGVIMAGNDGRRGFIHHTAIHPDYRRQKIAVSLVEEALKALAACGITKVALLVFKRNEAGNKFWKQMGFTERTDIVYRNKAIAELVRIDT